jgi:hypothetical protein
MNDMIFSQLWYLITPPNGYLSHLKDQIAWVIVAENETTICQSTLDLDDKED